MANLNVLDLNSGEEMTFLSNTQPTAASSDDVMNSKEVYDHRLSTCMQCQYVTQDRTCSECSCPVVMMAQMNFKTCPKEFW